MCARDMNDPFFQVWTTFILVPVDKKHQYDLPSDLWRIFVLVVAIVTFVQQVLEELWEYRYSTSQKKVNVLCAGCSLAMFGTYLTVR